MGLDVDYIAAKKAVEKIEKTLENVPHGKREKIADDIIEFSEKLKEKYKKEK